ncbi:MAG: twin-arginine translocase subunit TatC [Nitrospiraceae bacterium]|nr:twin-arginine translocase subunit TatC [Nitrospiraceae bacterium]
MSSAAQLRMTFWSHLDELRKRIVNTILWIAVGFGACFYYSEKILGLLLFPMNGKITLHASYPYVGLVQNQVQQKLHYTTLVEPFWSHLKIALIAGIMLVFPMIMYQVWKFIGPGLLTKERRFAGVFVFFSTGFFMLGMLFCYLLLLPFAIPFLLEYKTESLIAIITIGDYIDFVLKFLLACGAVFELPLVIVLLSRMGIAHPDTLAKYRKYAFLASFILGAILTPTPDVFNQAIMSIPIYLLYEVGILAARLFGRKKKEPESTALTKA